MYAVEISVQAVDGDHCVCAVFLDLSKCLIPWITVFCCSISAWGTLQGSALGPYVNEMPL